VSAIGYGIAARCRIACFGGRWSSDDRPRPLKAFLDDLAYDRYLSGSWMRLLELDDRFGGYEPSPGQTFSGVSCLPVQIYVYEAGTTPIGRSAASTSRASPRTSGSG
jgi:hypothetical protein